MTGKSKYVYSIFFSCDIQYDFQEPSSSLPNQCKESRQLKSFNRQSIYS